MAHSPEHESLLAVGRCLALHRGAQEAARHLDGVARQLGAAACSDLSPYLANKARKFLDPLLPLRGDFA
jgi:hypothetical protein